MRYAFVVLILLGTAAAQNTTGASVLDGQFDELFAAAPACKTMAMSFLKDGAMPATSACKQEAYDAIEKVSPAEVKALAADKKHLPARVKIIILEQNLLLTSMAMDAQSALIGSASQP